ncbi:hypothetical protein VTN02DRAFT_3961 [Thermoascus thermophilus]
MVSGTLYGKILLEGEDDDDGDDEMVNRHLPSLCFIRVLPTDRNRSLLLLQILGLRANEALPSVGLSWFFSGGWTQAGIRRCPVLCNGGYAWNTQHRLVVRSLGAMVPDGVYLARDYIMIYWSPPCHVRPPKERERNAILEVGVAARREDLHI